MNSEFYSSQTGCHTKVTEHSLSYYLSIAGGGAFELIPFPKILALFEMQTSSSRIWIQVVWFISYYDNRYTTSAYFISKVLGFMHGHWSSCSSLPVQLCSILCYIVYLLFWKQPMSFVSFTRFPKLGFFYQIFLCYSGILLDSYLLNLAK